MFAGEASALLLWAMDGPAAFGSSGFQLRGRINGVGKSCDFEHVEVVDGVPEDCIDSLWNVLLNGSDFLLVCRNLDELAGGLSVLHFDGSGQHAICRDAETTDAFFDHPVVGRRHGPDFASTLGQAVS